MVTLQMLLELEHVLQRLHGVPALWTLPVFTAAWQAVLITPLTKASLPLSDDQVKSCLHTVNLLQSCPVACQMDGSGMAQLFLQLGLDVCAAACLLMDPSLSHSDLQGMLSQEPTKVIEQSYSLTAQGLNLSSAAQVREVLFHLVLDRGEYHLLPPQAFPDFANFVIRLDDIDGCLLFALTNDMYDKAEMLMEVYFQHYPELYDEVLTWCERSGVSTDPVLQAYVQMKELV